MRLMAFMLIYHVMVMVCLEPYSPFSNPVRQLFPGSWKDNNTAATEWPQSCPTELSVVLKHAIWCSAQTYRMMPIISNMQTFEIWKAKHTMWCWSQACTMMPIVNLANTPHKYTTESFLLFHCNVAGQTCNRWISLGTNMQYDAQRKYAMWFHVHNSNSKQHK